MSVQSDNDQLRTTMRGGKVVLTARVAALPHDFYVEIIVAVQTCTQFADDDHSYGEVTVRGEIHFWLIEPDGSRLKMTIGHISELGI